MRLIVPAPVDLNIQNGPHISKHTNGTRRKHQFLSYFISGKCILNVVVIIYNLIVHSRKIFAITICPFFVPKGSGRPWRARFVPQDRFMNVSVQGRNLTTSLAVICQYSTSFFRPVWAGTSSNLFRTSTSFVPSSFTSFFSDLGLISW